MAVALQINCGYARVAIHELSSVKRGTSRQELDKVKRCEGFRELFSMPLYHLTDDMFTSTNYRPTRFDNLCESILKHFTKKWHPTSARLEYKQIFSISNSKALRTETKEMHSLCNCNACYNFFPALQKAYPGKPTYEPKVIVNIPPLAQEKAVARQVLAELNPIWESRYTHSFAESIPRMLPECNLVRKKCKVEKTEEDRRRKRKIVSDINNQLAQNATMTVLAEAESLASYSRKRLALSFQKPSIPQPLKSHSPREENMSWDVNNAMSELQNFPLNTKINWSAMARKYNIPHTNAGQILKETAIKHGIDTSRLENKIEITPRIRRRKCRLPGGDISMPSLPTVSAIKEEERQLILSGELNIGEPCAPFYCTKSVINDDGNVEIRSGQISGRKIPLHDLRTALLKKHESYMRLQTDTEIHALTKDEITAFMTTVHHQPDSDASLEELQDTLSAIQRKRTLAIWHDHSTILQTGYILFAVWVVFDPAVFYTQDEWALREKRQNSNNIYMIWWCMHQLSTV